MGQWNSEGMAICRIMGLYNFERSFEGKKTKSLKNKGNFSLGHLVQNWTSASPFRNREKWS